MSVSLRLGLAVILMLVLTPWPASGQTILRVDDDAPAGGDGATWPTAFRFLQDALTAAAGLPAPVEIRVAGGLYRPDQSELTPGGTADRSASFVLPTGISLIGGYSGLVGGDPDERRLDLFQSVLSGDLGGGVHAYSVLRSNDLDATATLDGFLVEGGRADGSNTMKNDQGGGFRIRAPEGSVVVRNTIFRDNFATFIGGAVTHGDLDEDVDSTSTFINCLFHDNSCDGFGGAIYESFADVRLINCTIADNAAPNGGGVYQNRGVMSVDNSIVYFNSPSQFQGSLNTLTGTYSVVQSGLSGSTIDSADPGFADRAGGDYRLAFGSPAIDSGDNSLVTTLVDLDGHQRLFDDPNTADSGAGSAPLVDIGPFEFGSIGPTTAEYVGPDGGSWFEPTNWSTGEVPKSPFQNASWRHR